MNVEMTNELRRLLKQAQDIVSKADERVKRYKNMSAPSLSTYTREEYILGRILSEFKRSGANLKGEI